MLTMADPHKYALNDPKWVNKSFYKQISCLNCVTKNTSEEIQSIEKEKI